MTDQRFVLSAILYNDFKKLLPIWLNKHQHIPKLFATVGMGMEAYPQNLVKKLETIVYLYHVFKMPEKP